MKYNTLRGLKTLARMLGPDYPVAKLPKVFPGAPPTFGDFVGRGVFKTVYASPCGRHVYKTATLDEVLDEVLALHQADALGCPVALPLTVYPEGRTFVQEKLQPLSEAPDEALRRFAHSLPALDPRITDVKAENLGYSAETDRVLVHDCLITETKLEPLKLCLLVKLEEWCLCTFSRDYPGVMSSSKELSCYMVRFKRWGTRHGELWWAASSSPFQGWEVSDLLDAIGTRGTDEVVRDFFATATEVFF